MARGWCKLHYDRWRKTGTTEYETFESDSARFWAKVDKSGDCWLWLGGISKRTNYGHFWINGTTTVAHRFAYLDLGGVIPVGMHLDHLCRVRACVNPDHLEPVTVTENILRGESPPAKAARKTHCKHGHEFTQENTYINLRGNRICRACQPYLGAGYPDRAKRSS